MWIVLTIIAIVIILNYYLGIKLFAYPQNENFYENVENITIEREKELAPSPKYIIPITILSGILIGIFHMLTALMKENHIYSIIFSIIILTFYTIEISRRITLDEKYLTLSKFFSPTIKIPLSTISGIYIYSYNKKFSNKHAFTTKLVVITPQKKYKFTISSLESKAVLSMIKNNFGVTKNKMYIANS